jgi:hypothetical protein
MKNRLFAEKVRLNYFYNPTFKTEELELGIKYLNKEDI